MKIWKLHIDRQKFICVVKCVSYLSLYVFEKNKNNEPRRNIEIIATRLCVFAYHLNLFVPNIHAFNIAGYLRIVDQSSRISVTVISEGFVH